LGHLDQEPVNLLFPLQITHLIKASVSIRIRIKREVDPQKKKKRVNYKILDIQERRFPRRIVQHLYGPNYRYNSFLIYHIVFCQYHPRDNLHHQLSIECGFVMKYFHLWKLLFGSVEV
jgi:hypothetical protein